MRKIIFILIILLLFAGLAWAGSDNDYTNAEKTIVGDTSGANSGDETDASIATINHAVSEKSAIVDADEVTGSDSADSFSLIRTTWTSVKAFLKTYFDTLYEDELDNSAGLKAALSDELNGGSYAVFATSFATGASDNGIIPTKGYVDDNSSAASAPFDFGTVSNPDVSAGAGYAAYDGNDYALKFNDGTITYLTAPKLRLCATGTIYNPDGIQATVDAITLLVVEAEGFPHGITMVDCGLKTGSSSTYSVNFEEWTSPTDGSPVTIETVATSSSTEAEDDGTLSDGAIAVGSIVKCDLPSTDIDDLVLWFTYYVNAGN